jgi:hypothetical protein
VAFAVAPANGLGAEGEPSVVFVTPDPPELDAALHDAVTAQLSGVTVDLVFNHFPGPVPTLREQVMAARSVSGQRHAAGVFWLDTQNDKEWLLYLAEPAGNRVLVRRVPVDSDGTAAGVESVAVILRQSTEALLSGQTIGMQQVEVPEEPLPRAAPPPEEPPPLKVAPKREEPPLPLRGLYLGVLYHGDAFASQVGWQSGVRLTGSYRWESGVHVGVGATVTMRIQRTPLDAHFGWSLVLGRWAPGVELRSKAEWVGRRNVADSVTVDGTDDRTRRLLSVSPNLTLDFVAKPGLFLHGGVGLDFVLNPFSYVIQGDAGTVTVLSPRARRPTAEVGITVRL